MNGPISPPPLKPGDRASLPAYLSNGLVGLRVRDNPLVAGMTLVSGYAGEHSARRIEAAAVAPFPLAGDLAVDGRWMSDAPNEARLIQQTYDFATAELTSRLRLGPPDHGVSLEILTFCSRDHPTLVCQEVTIEADAACALRFRALVDVRSIEGRAARHDRQTPGEAAPACDGALLWESAGGLSRVGVAFTTEFVGQRTPADRPPLDGAGMKSEYAWRARAGRRYRFRQLASLVPSVLHQQPDQEATRLAALARDIGFDAIRAANRACWAELWKSRIQLIGAGERWQSLADAGFFYLMSSVHPSSPASTSIFGLATWHTYHYYYGHVMWDIESFCVPPVTLLQPAAAKALLDYRHRSLPAARRNARLNGRRGAQFPWESTPSTGEEAAPPPGTAAWREDHVSLDVALAFALFADVTGDEAFARDKAWPVLREVAEWIESRAVASPRGFEIRASMGIAERHQAADNAVFTNMSARLVLEAAERFAGRLGRPADPAWRAIAEALVIPRRGETLVSHDGYRSNEEKGATPDPLMGVFPLHFPMDEAAVQGTLSYFLDQASGYIGSPMLSALFGVWAARTRDEGLALRMLDDGYGRFCAPPFSQTLEYRADIFPEQPAAGPFFANIGGFLSSLLLGFTRLVVGPGDPAAWPSGPIVLPAGWRAIEVERLWIRGEPWRLSAKAGAERTVLERGERQDG